MMMNDDNRNPGQIITPESTASTANEAAEDVLILVPMRNLVLFPGTVMPISVGRQGSVAAAQEAVRNERPIGLVLQRDPQQEHPTSNDLHPIGTIANILRYVTAPDGSHHLVCQGEERFRLREPVEGQPFMLTRYERLPAPETDDKEIQARLFNLRQQALEALKLLPEAPNELANAVKAIASGGALADLIANYLDLEPNEKQEILEITGVRARMDRVSQLLNNRLEILRLSHRINEQTKASIDERQREHLLREQMRTIQRELGEGEGKDVEIQELRDAVEKAGMSEEAKEQADKEIKRLERIPEGAAEYSMVRTYLDWLIELPWSKQSEESLDIEGARRILNEDHYDLDRVKRRILEYLAVHKLNPEGKSPILCFVGPPGVGKTSLGQSIARAMGREFIRISLGGVHDEAEIRGHRRTYIGALPGNIIQAIRKAGTKNPLFMLDEMDKLGASFQGDPSAALLEVLDPEQNSTFRDTYLGVNFDLSKVLFIGTANVLDTIPGPLRDRTEVIELPGYTEEEKVQIARRYLVTRRREANGLKEGQCELSDEVLHMIVRNYTREAGCRNLEREIGAIFRHAAMLIAEGKADKIEVKPQDLREILGPQKFEREVALRTSVSGVATGLAWTAAGGDILFIEATRVPGNGKLILTGQLGDVMKESAQAALSLAKSRAGKLGIDPKLFEHSDIHVHVPAGAIPKDGPSAGVAIFTALVSLLTERKVKSDTAMTGEITLRGMVLPIGGVKEKSLAALRAGIKNVLLPARNKREFEEIPEDARDKLNFVWVDTVDEAIAAALASNPQPEQAKVAARPEATSA
jgi:ATP-dependent Lon protease